VILMCGAAAEIEAALPDIPIAKLAVGETPEEDAEVDLAIFDLRAGGLAAFASVRASTAVMRQPLLLVASEAPSPRVFELLRADDAIVIARDDAETIRRKVLLYAELGQLRRGRPEALVLMRKEKDDALRRLQETERFDHAILDGVNMGIITTDADGAVTFVNRTAAQLLDVDSESIGADVELLLGLPLTPDALLAGELCRTVDYLLTRRDGEELDIEVSVSRGMSSEPGTTNGGPGYFFIFRDVREDKQRVEERARFERLAAMGTMVAGFAHEVRNPVAAMRSIAEELDEELRDSGVTTPHVALMLRMLERIERLVRTSLQFGRPAAPKRSPQRPWLIVQFALAELRPRLRGLGGELVVEIDDDLPSVNVDEKQIAQALVVLLNNALDATSEPGRVTVRVTRERRGDDLHSDAPPPSTVRFEVKDDGAGIAPEIFTRIFDPFFTTKPTGTGLGLSIAQQIVSENGARLEVTSNPAVATTFAIVIATSG